MKNISIMIKPASSLCNLSCEYCFYEDVSSKRAMSSCGVMKRETANKIIDNVLSCLNDMDAVSFVFQGGEPTLAGLPFFLHFTEEVEKKKGSVLVNYAIQTNGILIDKSWCRFFKSNNFLVGISQDILPEVHDKYRKDTNGSDTYERVNAARKALLSYGVEYNILSVLTNDLAKEPEKVWDYLCRENIGYTQFIPCLGKIEGEKKSCRLNPCSFAGFYSHLFFLWAKAFKAGKYRSIKLFDDLINLLAYGKQTACGITGKCSPQFVVEADGRVFPCDFYALDEYCIGNLACENVEDIYNKAAKSSFITRDDAEADFCCRCPYLKICHGGCLRMRKEVCGFDGENECGYRLFLDNCLPELQQIIHSILN
ncbi:radical SAM/SPASM domain-containing protein [Butyrivibrio sp. WCD3002]|uniref:radical SAM/SPASM domain-containing protein n=1 Tax=Butyrivibrio sp. WCD3002 TaxID=1280676 RepID=UPI00047EBA64